MHHIRSSRSWKLYPDSFFIATTISTIYGSIVAVQSKKPYTSSFANKKPVDFDDELKTGDVRYDNLT